MSAEKNVRIRTRYERNAPQSLIVSNTFDVLLAYREHLQRLYYVVAEPGVEGFLYGHYLGGLLLGERVGEVLAHQRAAVAHDIIQYVEQPVGDSVQHPQREQREKVTYRICQEVCQSCVHFVSSFYVAFCCGRPGRATVALARRLAPRPCLTASLQAGWAWLIPCKGIYNISIVQAGPRQRVAQPQKAHRDFGALGGI